MKKLVHLFFTLVAAVILFALPVVAQIQLQQPDKPAIKPIPLTSDPDNTITESDEGNNSYKFACATYLFVDYLMEGFSCAKTTSDKVNFSCDVVVKNAGTACTPEKPITVTIVKVDGRVSLSPKRKELSLSLQGCLRKQRVLSLLMEWKSKTASSCLSATQGKG